MSRRVEIKVTSDETEMTAKAIAAMVERGDVYQRSGRLFEPRLDPARLLRGLVRPAEELKLVEIGVPRVRSILAECTEFYVLKDGDRMQQPTPDRIPLAIHSMPTWPGIPVIESISENPILRPDGTIHDTEGYDPYTGNFFNADGVKFPPIPENPTREDARAAFDVLLEPFCNFPFVTDCDRSVVAAVVLTMLARPAIPGPTPPFVIRTPTPRTGKDLLTDVMTLIGTGRPAPGRSLPKNNEEELNKLLLALGLSGARVISFGNCEGGIGSAALSHVVTRDVFSQRLLSKNIEVTVPMRPVWLFNGNNVFFKGDFGPRVVLCNMDAKVADPQSRKNWRYDPLLPWVRENRPRLVVAGLTILRAFYVAGAKKHGGTKKGSFEGWDDIVRSALLWTGVADPLGNDKDVRVDSDADIETLLALLAAWRRAFGSQPVTLREVVEASQAMIIPITGSDGKQVKLDDAVKKDLAAALAAVDTHEGDRYTAASLRYALRHHKGRPVDIGDSGDPTEILSLEIASKRHGPAKVTAWHVLDAVEREKLAQRGRTSTPPPIPAHVRIVG